MKVNKFTGFIVVLTFSLLSIYIIILKNDREQIQQNYKAELETRNSMNTFESGLLANAYQLQQASWLNSIYGINEKTILTDIHDTKTALIDKLDGLSLLFYFDSNVCSPCLNREIENMKLLANSFRNLNLVIVTQGFPSNYIFKDSKFSDLESSIFVTKENPFSAGLLVDSPTFVLFKNRKPLFYYHPDKNHNMAFEKLLQVFEQTIPNL